MSQIWAAATREVFRDKIVLAGTGLVLAVLGAAGWMFFGNSPDNPAYTHMHCPVCEEEVPYNARLAGFKCSACGDAATYIATVGSFKDGAGAAGTGAKVVVFLLMAAVLLQGLAFVAVGRLKTLRRVAEEARTRTLVCRCPYCGRKVGFPASKTGSAGLCPRCKTAFVFALCEDEAK